MNDIFTHHRWLLWLGSGFCFGLSSVYVSFWWLSLLGFVLLLKGITTQKYSTSILLGGLLVGVLKSAGGIVWWWSTYPLDWLIEGSAILQLSLIGIFWLSCSVALGSGIACCVYITHQLFTRFGHKAFVAFPFLWIAGEVLGSLIFSLYSYGPGAYVTTEFSFGYVGYTIAHLSFAEVIAALGGVYALSGVAALFGLVIFFLIHNTSSIGSVRAWQVFGSVVLVCSVLYFVAPPQEVSPLHTRVVAVDTTFSSQLLQSPEGKTKKKRDIAEATVAAVQDAPDIVLLPEDSRFTGLFATPADALMFLQEKVGTSTTIVVDTARTVDEQGETVQRAFYYDLGEEAVYMIDKQYLVPQGEFVPQLVTLAMDILGKDEMLANISANRSYRMGNIADYAEFPEHIPGVLFCFESSSPFAVQKISSERSGQLILHPVSHAWFHESNVLVHQLDTMLKIQAIWNHKTIVQAGNMTAGKVYTPDGNILSGNILVVRDSWRLVEYNL